MGVFKKSNGHKTILGKIGGALGKAVKVAAPLAGAVFGGPAGAAIGGKVGAAIGRVKSKVESVQVKVSDATAGQIDLKKLLPQRAENARSYGARMTKGLGAAAAGFSTQAAIPTPEGGTFEDNLKAGFIAEKIPSWLLWAGGAVGVLLIAKKLFKF